MKKLLLTFLISNAIQAMQTNSDFTRRFGSNSTIYNTPLYFNEGRHRIHKKQKATPPKQPKKLIAKKNQTKYRD
jgi:hypothetical protein